MACIAQAAEASGAGAQLASWADGGGSNVRDGHAAEAVGEDEAEGLSVAHVSSPPPSVSGARAREAPVTSPRPRLEVRVEGGEELFTADAVVLAVGATAAARLRASSPVLLAQPSTRGFDRLRGITCVAVRLYLSPASYRTAGLGGGAFDSTLLPAQVASAMVASPVLVAGPAIGGLPELRETGFCVYDLQRLHPELASGDLAVLEVTEIAGEHSPPHSVYSSRLSVGARMGFDRGSTPSLARTSLPGLILYSRPCQGSVAALSLSPSSTLRAQAALPMGRRGSHTTRQHKPPHLQPGTHTSLKPRLALSNHPTPHMSLQSGPCPG